MGEGKESARAQVLASRALLDEELVRLEASARAAVDIPAKVKRHPVKAAGVAAGAGFVVLGGPRRVLRGARNAVFGRPDPLPKSMLPDEIERAIKELGPNGERVRGTLEREFSRYLADKGPERRERDMRRLVGALMWTLGRPIAVRAGWRLADTLVATDPTSYAERLAMARERVRAAAGKEPAP